MTYDDISTPEHSEANREAERFAREVNFRALCEDVILRSSNLKTLMDDVLASAFLHGDSAGLGTDPVVNPQMGRSRTPVMRRLIPLLEEVRPYVAATVLKVLEADAAPMTGAEIDAWLRASGLQYPPRYRDRVMKELEAQGRVTCRRGEWQLEGEIPSELVPRDYGMFMLLNQLFFIVKQLKLGVPGAILRQLELMQHPERIPFLTNVVREAFEEAVRPHRVSREAVKPGEEGRFVWLMTQCASGERRDDEGWQSISPECVRKATLTVLGAVAASIGSVELIEEVLLAEFVALVDARFEEENPKGGKYPWLAKHYGVKAKETWKAWRGGARLYGNGSERVKGGQSGALQLLLLQLLVPFGTNPVSEGRLMAGVNRRRPGRTADPAMVLKALRDLQSAGLVAWEKGPNGEDRYRMQALLALPRTGGEDVAEKSVSWLRGVLSVAMNQWSEESDPVSFTHISLVPRSKLPEAMDDFRRACEEKVRLYNQDLEQLSEDEHRTLGHVRAHMCIGIRTLPVFEKENRKWNDS